MLAGALTDPVDSALFIWKNSSKEVPTHPAAYKAFLRLVQNLSWGAFFLSGMPHVMTS